MLRNSCIALAALLLASSVFADHPIMGNWEGQITSRNWKGERVSAQVVGMGNGSYRVLFAVGPEEGTQATAELAGIEREGAAVFVGRIDLGEKRGGTHTVTAQAVAGTMQGQLYGKPDATFSLNKVYKKSPTLGAAPPDGAVVLFDGTNLDAWKRAPDDTAGGILRIIRASNFISKDEFGDAKIHVEFCPPYMPEERGQGRGNSGVYVQGRYEIQVLDSYMDPPADNFCGGIYRIAAPKTNACLPPGEWQTYDITFYAPRFDAAGNKTKEAEITVLQNGVLIHDALKLPGITPGGVSDKEAPRGPLFLQNHGDEVQYRNIWVLPLD